MHTQHGDGERAYAPKYTDNDRDCMLFASRDTKQTASHAVLFLSRIHLSPAMPPTTPALNWVFSSLTTTISDLGGELDDLGGADTFGSSVATMRGRTLLPIPTKSGGDKLYSTPTVLSRPSKPNKQKARSQASRESRCAACAIIHDEHQPAFLRSREEENDEEPKRGWGANSISFHSMMY